MCSLVVSVPGRVMLNWISNDGTPNMCGEQTLGRGHTTNRYASVTGVESKSRAGIGTVKMKKREENVSGPDCGIGELGQRDMITLCFRIAGWRRDEREERWELL